MPRSARVLLLALSLFGCAHPLPRVLSESRSGHGDLIVIEEMAGVRSLRFERHGVIQSLIRIGHPLDLQLAYSKAAMTALALVETPRRILVVGLGGGAMPMFLRTTIPDATIDVVDLDPAVIELARRFFGFREDDRLRAFADDGRAFVEGSDGNYDLIFLDAYGSSDIPRHLATLEFLRTVRERLSPSGVVVGNVFGADLNPSFGAMYRTYAAAFDQLCVFEIPLNVNWIFLGRGSAPASIDAELSAKAAALSARYGLPFEIGPYAERGCMAPKVDGGEVLRDGPAPP